MALSVDDLQSIIELKTSGHLPRDGAVIDLGSQRVDNRALAARTKILELGALFGASGDYPLPPPLRHADGHPPADAELPMAELLWRWLGYDYASIDIDGTPGCIPLDLNYDSVPDAQRGQYHIVTNFGTTEHVANQCNAFKVVHDLTALGGMMMHNVPAQGMLTHGLVNYTHKFFWMLARSNGYDVIKLSFMIEPLEYSLPENIRDTTVVAHGKKHAENHQETDCGLVVILRKIFDIPFVAPIDVNTGTRTDNEVLKERYWTVFQPAPFDGLPRHRQPS
jgi:hypothetical protein